MSFTQHPATVPALVGLDWGTSSLRAFLFGRDGAVLDRASAPLGIMQVVDGDFAGAFASVAGRWLAEHPALPAIAGGMIGSAQGWREIPYHRGPARLADIVAGLVAIPTGLGGELRIIPGMITDGTTPEVMRGEETQIFGALGLQPELAAEGVFVLPGTHCKWVHVRDGRITGFHTFMTGELFAVLRQHSILGRPSAQAGRPPSPGDGAFRLGVTTARDSQHGAVPLLFSARTLVLAGRLPAEDSLDYLSGLLIGDELRAALPDVAGSLAFIGEPALCDRYQTALSLFGVTATRRIEGATEAGLWQVARAANLVAGSE